MGHFIMSAADSISSDNEKKVCLPYAKFLSCQPSAHITHDHIAMQAQWHH